LKDGKRLRLQFQIKEVIAITINQAFFVAQSEDSARTIKVQVGNLAQCNQSCNSVFFGAV
jgi:hypothetical protein